MAYIKGQDRHQVTIPQPLDDMVDQESPCRVMDAFVDSLDLSSLGFTKDQPAHTGRPAYGPRDLLKLYIYGYFHSIRSSRKLMTECKRNIELFFLLGHLTPDFRTIADFRKENSKAILTVFREFTRFCLTLNLYEDELLAIDGSKFRAVNGNKKMYNETILAKKLERIEAKLATYMKTLEDEDQSAPSQEETKEEDPPDGLKKKIQTLQERKTLYKGYQKELAESGHTQKLTTDPEARMMHSHKDGFHCCYNVQTAASSKTHLILDYQVTNHINDQELLSGFCEQIKHTIKRPLLKIVADKGYDSKEELLSCVSSGTIPYVGFCSEKPERLIPIDYYPAAVTKKERNSKAPKDIETCLHTGVLPKCYENMNLSLEVKEIGEIGAFTRGEDQSFVICPMGMRLPKVKNKGPGMVYGKRSTCQSCTNRCTASTHHKTVYFGPTSNCVAARMYGEKKAMNLPPPGFVPTNSFFKKNPITKTVLLRIKDDIPKQKQRLCISEHPFGTVKWHHGAHYFFCKGIVKTSAEMGLSFLAYNLKRAINLVGTKQLIEAMRGVWEAIGAFFLF